MIVNMSGWHWKHPEDMKIIRPNGIHGMQIVLIQSRARVVIAEKEYKVGANTAFVMDSCVPHDLYADGEEYIDDWIRFELEDNDKDLLYEMGIELNVPIELDDDIVSRLISVCVDVAASGKPEKEEVERKLMSAIFLQIKSCCNPEKKTKRTHYDRELDSMRRQIYDDPSADWNIPAMAEQLSLSVPHFQRLYKQKYGVPCTKDILTSRMEYAKQLLISTDLSAVEVSEKCGYSDYSHFSKVFQKYACVSPAKFRKDK